MLPTDVPFADFGEVVEIAEDDDFVNARAYSDGLIVEMDPQMQRELIAEKYQIVGHDNEGFEAEIFFARGSETVGTIQMRDGPCEGIVTLLLTYTSPEKKKADDE